MRVWLIRLRTALAALAAIYLLWELPTLFTLFAKEGKDPGSLASPACVLRVWICEDWTGSGMQWLTKQTAQFEKKNKGTRVLLRRVQGDEWLEDGVIQPDMLLFDANAVSEPALIFEPMPQSYPLRPLLQAAGVWKGVQYAAPVCYGGYLRIYNDTLDEGAELVMNSEREYQEFIAKNGRTLIATVREARRLSALEAAGKGFPFHAEPYGEKTNKLLLLGKFSCEGSREEQCQAYIDFLLGVEAQNALAEYGLLPASALADAPDESKYPVLFSLEQAITYAANAFD